MTFGRHKSVSAMFICLCYKYLGKILDKEGQEGTFILDFEKAFDAHLHELLKSELFGYGIGGKTLRWIDSFLCYRAQ